MENQNLQILIIDDSQAIIDFITEYILEPNGYQYDIARNGVEGLQKALAHPPDLILTDFEMPKMTGPEVLRALNKQSCKIPAILMTSHGSEDIAVEVFRLGVSDYITKPFEAEQMLQAMEEALTTARLKREKEALLQRLLEANNQLEKNINELKTLSLVGKSITTLMPPQQMLERIVEAVLNITQSQLCSLSLADPETGQIQEQIRKERNRKEISENAKVISVPLHVGPKIVGELTVQEGKTLDFNEHDEQLLRMLADYAAIAVHNLQLMYQLQRRKEEEKQQIRNLFKRYVAPSVVEQLLAHPNLVKLGGTRETVAVLFADVRGFSTFSTHTPPEVLVDLLNKYMQAAAEAILVEEGTLDKFMGDAVMAFFNAPLPQQDYPLRAIRAAWALRASVKKVHEQLPKAYQLHFGIGVGVGEAVVGNIGAAQLMNFTLIGDAVNKVKRLQENAKGGQILISQETYQMVKSFIRAEYIGDIHLKGQANPEPVFEVLEVSRLSGLAAGDF